MRVEISGMTRGDKMTKLLRYLRGDRDARRADPFISDTGSGAECCGTFGDWRERFIALIDHTGVIARTSAIPALVGIGDDLDQLCGRFRDPSDELGSWRPLGWPSWPDSAILIDGTLKMFELIERVLGAAGGSGVEESDPLEMAWNESTVVLLKEAAELKGGFIAGVLAAPQIDPGAR